MLRALWSMWMTTQGLSNDDDTTGAGSGALAPTAAVVDASSNVLQEADVGDIHIKTSHLLSQDVTKMSLNEKLGHLEKLHKHASDLSNAMDALQEQLKKLEVNK